MLDKPNMSFRFISIINIELFADSVSVRITRELIMRG